MVFRLLTLVAVWALLLVLPVDRGWSDDRLRDSCEKKVKKVLQGILKEPMERRASLAWKELGQEEVHCGHSDPTLLKMAWRASTLKGVKREWEIGRVLRRYSGLKVVCPAGTSALDKVDAVVPKKQVDFLADYCPVKEPLGSKAGKDLGPMTFLYVQVLRHYWEGEGVWTNSHQILLSTLLLSSALERGAIDDLIDHLDDPKPVAKDREGVEEFIKRRGLESIPVLINRIDDQGPAGEEGGEPPGHCMNLPIFEMGNPPDDCLNLEVYKHPVTVGERCRRLLYEILTPAYEPLPEQGRILWKTRGEGPFVIRDWIQWWGNHQGRGLEEIHSEARRLNDRFWRRGWEKGPIEWK